MYPRVHHQSNIHNEKQKLTAIVYLIFQDKQVTIKVPTDLVSVSGECDVQISRMNLNWVERSQDSTFASNEKENVISFRLLKTNAYTFIYGITIDIFLDDTNFPNAERMYTCCCFDVASYDTCFLIL